VAFLDRDRGLIVIRIVYDGPALSGKTTTLRALARGLGGTIFSGDEAEGRTLYFDWLDYTGGRFEGHPIRCQAVSVPGQRLLRARRDRILEGADSVVFVADTRRQGLDASGRMLASLHGSLQNGAEPRPGIVVQANQRDAPDAATADHVRRVLGADGAVAIMESVASDGVGVREAFVLAVRLALDRVRELMRTHQLREAGPDLDSWVALLDDLRAREREVEVQGGVQTLSIAAVAMQEALHSEVGRPATVREAKSAEAAERPREAGAGPRALAASRPRLPAADIPGGMIWPPIGGRIVLHESVVAGLSLEELPDGSWTAVSGRHARLHSYHGDLFPDAETSRLALIEWARWHTGALARLSPRRCILAADAGRGGWRLWQIVRGERTMRVALEQVLSRSAPEQVARGLLDLARSLDEGASALAPLGLHCSVDTLGFVESGLVYVGLTPAAGAPIAEAPATGLAFEDRLRTEFGPIVARGPSVAGFDVPRVLHHLVPIAGAAGQARAGKLLAAMLIGH
jgi:signal recognition particle receptor subunit beta